VLGPRPLKQQSLEVAAPQRLVFEVVSSAGKVVEKRSDTEKVVEFSIELGDRTIVTRELITLEPPERISYRWLEGPLPHVEEEIEVRATGEKRAEMVYRGEYATGKGLRSCIAGYLWVKRVFDRLVTDHLEEAKRISEERAERSRLY
jgi:hypothetical protein